MYAIYIVTFTINIPQMLAYIPNIDPMGHAYAHDGIEMDDAILKVWTDPLFWDKPARVNIKIR